VKRQTLGGQWSFWGWKGAAASAQGYRPIFSGGGDELHSLCSTKYFDRAGKTAVLNCTIILPDLPRPVITILLKKVPDNITKNNKISYVLSNTVSAHPILSTLYIYLPTD